MRMKRKLAISTVLVHVHYQGRHQHSEQAAPSTNKSLALDGV